MGISSSPDQGLNRYSEQYLSHISPNLLLAEASATVLLIQDLHCSNWCFIRPSSFFHIVVTMISVLFSTGARESYDNLNFYAARAASSEACISSRI